MIGNATLEHAESHDGNKFILVSNRNEPFSSFSQSFHLQKDKLYTFSGNYFSFPFFILFFVDQILL